MQPLRGEDMRLDERSNKGSQHGSAGAHLVGQGRQADRHAFAGVAFGLAVQRLMLAELLEQRSWPAGSGPPSRAAMTWKGAGAWLIVSQSRQVNFSRTCWITFHCRGMTSSVSVTSSPSLRSASPPQQLQAVGPGTTTRSRGRCSGNGLRAGRLRMKAATTCRGPGRGLLGLKLILGGCGLQLLQLQFHLVEQARRPLRARAVDLAPELLDLQLQMRDQGSGTRRLGTGLRKLGITGKKQMLQRLDIIRKRIIGAHHRHESQNAARV